MKREKLDKNTTKQDNPYDNFVIDIYYVNKVTKSMRNCSVVGEVLSNHVLMGQSVPVCS